MSENNQVIIAQPAQVKATQEVTAFEQVIAALAGLLTAGPLGAVASYWALRGLQGKWAPWTILGIIGAPVCIVVQIMVLGATTDAEAMTHHNALPCVQVEQSYSMCQTPF
jgi:hypothetical protein